MRITFYCVALVCVVEVAHRVKLVDVGLASKICVFTSFYTLVYLQEDVKAQDFAKHSDEFAKARDLINEIVNFLLRVTNLQVRSIRS